MKIIFKKVATAIVSSLIELLYISNAGRYLIDLMIKKIKDKNIKISHNKIDLNFYVPNRLCYYRVKTFSSKEPETLLWIDSFKEKEIFWDIGANIGLYSCYAGLKNINVYSFEPSVFNLEILAKNIFKNKLESKISIIPLALSNNNKIELFNMSNIDYGGAMSGLSEKIYDQDANLLKKVFKYRLLTTGGHTLKDIWNLRNPDHIKIDVDGIEYLILRSLDGMLENTKSILVEVDKKFYSNNEVIKEILIRNKFKLKKNLFDNRNQFNQIWYKDNNE